MNMRFYSCIRKKIGIKYRFYLDFIREKYKPFFVHTVKSLVSVMKPNIIFQISLHMYYMKSI